MTDVQDPRTTDALPAARTAETAWAEPGAVPRGSRPRSQYWDVMTARWVSRSPIPLPRRGD